MDAACERPGVVACGGELSEPIGMDKVVEIEGKREERARERREAYDAAGVRVSVGRRGDAAGLSWSGL